MNMPQQSRWVSDPDWTKREERNVKKEKNE